jgi:Pentapeptide repeats (8 copies)
MGEVMPINQLVDGVTNSAVATPELDPSIMLYERYQAGERNFADQDFGGVSLPEEGLAYANFRRSQLKQVDLSGANLRGIDLSETNLSRSNLRHADLRGASLTNAMLFMAALDGSNLQGADLSGASLDITTLAQANLAGANLCGTYLAGMDLREVNLRGAYFDAKTQFDPGFDPIAAGMRGEVSMTIDDLLTHLNQLSQCTSRYLGGAMTAKYWEKSRFDTRYLADFTVDGAGHFGYAGAAASMASLLQLKWTQLWLNKFIGNCALIFQDIPDIAAKRELLVIARG